MSITDELAPLLAQLKPGQHLLISGDDGARSRYLREAGLVVSACCHDIPAAMQASALAGLPVRAAPLARIKTVVPFDGACLLTSPTDLACDLAALHRLLKPGAPLLLANLQPPAVLPTGWAQEGPLLLRQ